MPGLQVFQYAVLTDARGERHTLGSMVDPANLYSGYSGLVERKVYSLAASTTVAVYDPAASPASSFTFLWIRSDRDDVMVELTTDTNNGVGDERYTVKLRKNLALVLGSDDSYANYTANFAGGTLDVIDYVRIRNIGSETASIEVVVAK
jgi:hypothetical protein